MNKELGIYIHIPFCKRKCDYCDFTSFENNNSEQIEKYISKIIIDINDFEFSKYNVTTIYIGGGTPSYIDGKYIEKIINQIKDKLKDNETSFDNIETTIEVNPGTATIEKFKLYKTIGINRISIGLQTTNDELLKDIGRIHSYKEFEEVYHIAKDIGFSNINFDLMIGLPNQKIIDIKDYISTVQKLNPEHISVYSLIVEEDTKIDKKIRNGELILPEEELERQMYWYVKNKLELLGYNHYEISNFSKIGKESKHNLNCWNQQEYIGFGLGAHSYINNIRFSNIQETESENLLEYKNNVEETQESKEKMSEYMLLGLRKINGINISEFKQKFIENPIFIFKDQLDELVSKDLIVIDGDNIRLSNKGIDFANLVWEKFI